MSAKPAQYTVRYGYDGDKFTYCHTITPDLAVAIEACDSWLAGGGFGKDPERLRVWVVDRTGNLMHGTEAVRA